MVINHIRQTSNGVKICGLQKTTLIDFPGRPAATIFLCGCNFRCPWCYAPHLVLPSEIKKQLYPPQVFAKQKFGRAGISEEELFDFLEERKEFLDAVTICGGEPCLNKDLPEFCRKIKKLGYLIKLDTNGSNPEMLAELIRGDAKITAKRDSLSSLTSLPQSGSSLIDYVAMDIKVPKERYQEVLGVDVKNIEDSIKILKGAKIDYEFRTTIVPSIHTKEDLLKIAKWLSPAKKYYLQNFRAEKTIDPKFERIRPYPDEYLKEIQKEISSFFESCEVR